MATASVANPDATVERGRLRRADRYIARSHLWDLSTLKRVRLCGKVSVRQDKTVAVRHAIRDGRASVGYAGLYTCGSVWACPVCSAKIARHRQGEIEQTCAWWERQGGTLAMATFTVSHRRGQSLKSVWKAVTDGWHEITSGRAWKRNSATFGIEGWIRVLEVTHGANGWHVHVHTLFLLHHGLAQFEQHALSAALLGRWRTGIGKHGFSASSRRGVDLRQLHGADPARVLADYFTKGVYSPDGTAAAVAGLELARGDLKETRSGGSRTPFRILYDLLEYGDADDAELWAEWEQGSYRKRQMAWSKGLRELVRITDKSDEDIAADELGSADDDVLVLTAETVTATRYVRHELLDALEARGLPGLRDWLHVRGLSFMTPLERLRT